MDDRKHRTPSSATHPSTQLSGADHRKTPPESPVEAVPVPDALDTGDLALETDEMYDGDTHNPYMHDHETLHKHRPASARVDHHDLAPWIDLVRGIENAKKHDG